MPSEDPNLALLDEREYVLKILEGYWEGQAEITDTGLGMGQAHIVYEYKDGERWQITLERLDD